jgi:hypothetical protein
MPKLHRQGPPEPDPLEDLRDEVASLKSEVVALHSTVADDLKEIKSSLGDILRVLESKGAD